MNKQSCKIVTKKGDKGMTKNSRGESVTKDCEQIEANGAIEELNSSIGILIATPHFPHHLQILLEQIQHHLLDLGAIISNPSHELSLISHVELLDQAIETLGADLNIGQTFIIPGGTPTAAHAFHACTICRRAERRVYSFAHDTTIDANILVYLNRLSDLLFIIAVNLMPKQSN